MISLTFPNKSNSNAHKAENKYFFLMKVRSIISNNHAQTRIKSFNMLANKAKEREN